MYIVHSLFYVIMFNVCAWFFFHLCVCWFCYVWTFFTPFIISSSRHRFQSSMLVCDCLWKHAEIPETYLHKRKEEEKKYTHTHTRNSLIHIYREPFMRCCETYILRVNFEWRDFEFFEWRIYTKRYLKWLLKRLHTF